MSRNDQLVVASSTTALKDFPLLSAQLAEHQVRSVTPIDVCCRRWTSSSNTTQQKLIFNMESDVISSPFDGTAIEFWREKDQSIRF